MEKGVEAEGPRSAVSDSALSEKTDMEMSIDPEDATFPLSGVGRSDHMIVNFTKSRLALKAKCSNNDVFRVNPVFQIIEANKCKNVSISKNPGPVGKKSDKVIVMYHQCDDKVTDVKAFFKELESKNPEAIKFVKITISSGENEKKARFDR